MTELLVGLLGVGGGLFAVFREILAGMETRARWALFVDALRGKTTSPALILEPGKS
jgi:hypothetical protein